MKRHRLLLIDDDPFILKSTADWLREKNFDVAAAVNGKKALEMIGSAEFDLVITELALDAINGITILRKIKQIDEGIKVIIFTGCGEVNSAIDALRLGADDYMLKPCDPDEIYLRVNNCVTKLDMERQIKNVYEDMEKQIEARTAELKAKSQDLEELNATLRVLLKQREEDKKMLEENILSNVKELVVPYLEKIKTQTSFKLQKEYADAARRNLDDIVSPFVSNLSLKYINLTPTEIQIANLIKQGASTKEIAELMNLALSTIATHRNNLRAKLGLRNQKKNLRTHLLIY